MTGFMFNNVTLADVLRTDWASEREKGEKESRETGRLLQCSGEGSHSI